MDPIPTSVKEFLYAHIDSIDQLEILRLVVDDSQNERLSSVLAHELQIPVTTVALHVSAMAAKGLLTIVATDPLTCKQGAKSSMLDGHLEQLMKTYRERPVSLIRLVYDRPKEQRRSLSDAFRLKKDE